ncbi:MAG: EAL domain-containing protein [Thiolinea sp.]
MSIFLRKSLAQESFISFLQQHILNKHYQPGFICLELNERQIVNNISQTRLAMEKLQAAGILFALDQTDGSSGFASHGFIRHLPLGMLKIDGELIVKIETSQNALSMVSSIISMADSMGIQVAAEYVKNARILQLLK